MIEEWHGLQLQRPLQRMRETVILLRQILAGERSSIDGVTINSKGYRQPPAKVPLFLAALRPRMLELAAEVGDGVVLNLFPRSALPKIMQHIHIGGERSGKTEVPVACRYLVAVTENKQMVIENFRSFMSAYFATPVYNHYLAWCGFPEAASEIAKGWEQGDRKRTARALPDALLNEIAIIGTAEQCRERIANYARSGINTHIITSLVADPKISDATFHTFAQPLEL